MHPGDVAANHVSSAVHIAAADIRHIATDRPNDLTTANLTGELLTEITESATSYATTGATNPE